ncbi:ABC transporter substrate-binding protein [Nocardioides aurantiacus]|uniref:Amino acid/amide ABC transporter substrate-binding protein (HAAT family) n=1 Tax=Nocardioides aurantiacus TaxID=86796 RepID=A0A3N2CWI8_9ACTN|nr:ABC transporter substrate-binding protein [Nocardioides aurantiacus]ROR91917.1 amino acid/amide ABC transporter substrate-binding protein (HAAT family) [Nocardioides aurantiacus]
MEIEAALTDPLEAQHLPRPAGRVRVALAVPQSGPLGLTGPSALDAALLAAHETNVQERLRGRVLDLVLVDAGRRPGDVARDVADLATRGLVDAVVGFHTSDVHRAVESALAGRTPYVFTPPHEGGRRLPGVVCLGADPSQQLRGSIAWLTRTHRLRRWALVGSDYIWPRSVHRHARRLVAEQGATVVLEARVPLGGLDDRLARLLDDLVTSRADAVLLSMVGRDLATFNTAARRTGLDRRLVRLSGALEENGLLAARGDRTGTLYAAMPSFASLTDDDRTGLAERHAALLGPRAPVLDSYAEGVYDGVRLVAALAGRDALGTASLRRGAPEVAELRRRRGMHLARAEAFDLAVVAGTRRDTGQSPSIWK